MAPCRLATSGMCTRSRAASSWKARRSSSSSCLGWKPNKCGSGERQGEGARLGSTGGAGSSWKACRSSSSSCTSWRRRGNAHTLPGPLLSGGPLLGTQAPWTRAAPRSCSPLPQPFPFPQPNPTQPNPTAPPHPTLPLLPHLVSAAPPPLAARRRQRLANRVSELAGRGSPLPQPLGLRQRDCGREERRLEGVELRPGWSNSWAQLRPALHIQHIPCLVLVWWWTRAVPTRVQVMRPPGMRCASAAHASSAL